MKKLLYLLLLLPLTVFTACDDKDDLAPFDMTLTVGGVTQSDNSFYAVSGDDVTIESLTVDPVGGKTTDVANVMFYLDNVPLWVNPWQVGEPISFSTVNIPIGVHTIGITGNLLQVGQSIQTFASNYSLVIVGSQEDLPEGAPAIGSYSQTINVSK